MNVMRYKGYMARVDYSDADGCFIGRIEGIRDVIGFHGESVGELRAAFREAVNDYLATCARLRRNPQKPCSGKILLRIDPALHSRAAALAKARGRSLNSLAQEALERVVAEE